MRFYGAEYNNIEQGEAEFNIVVLCSIKPHIETSSSVVIFLLHKALFYYNFKNFENFIILKFFENSEIL